MNHRGRDDISIWEEEDGFYYDVLHLPNGDHFPLKVRSMVGLIPLLRWRHWSRVLERMPASVAALTGLSRTGPI